MHGLSCCTAQKNNKYSESVRLPCCLVLELQQKFVYGGLL